MSSLLKSTRIPGRLRHDLAPPLGPVPSPAHRMSVEQLRRHLQTAIELEHSTIPPYLCALYSMDERRNAFAHGVVQGVVMEEMLHMIQAANLLVAIGGRPTLTSPHFIPEYPTFLPHSDDAFLVPLQRFSRETLGVFLQIEMPAAASAPPEPDRYHTIGQFYAAVRDTIVSYGDAIFTGDPSHQVTPDQYYGGGGEIVPVRGMTDALEAIDQIVGQGEGIDGRLVDTNHVLFGERIEYAHYFRFNEVAEGRRYRPGDDPHRPPTGEPVPVDWDAVRPMRANPKLADYPVDSALWTMTRDCNYVYMRLLNVIEAGCTGAPSRLGEAIPLMYDLKYRASALMNVPLGDAPGETAGPSFEYLAF
jgi:hypothetical protein